MNNLATLAKIGRRNTLESNIISNLKKYYPNFDQSISAIRTPLLPKIVVYASAASSDSFLKKITPFFSVITPNPTNQSDEQISRRIAENLTQPGQGQQQSVKFGYFLKGFPFNVRQALLLDQYLNGVNLAISLKSENDNTDYTSSIQPLLNYYSQRGTLVQISHSSNPTLSQIQNALQQIRTKIKRNF